MRLPHLPTNFIIQYFAYFYKVCYNRHKINDDFALLLVVFFMTSSGAGRFWFDISRET